MNKKINLTGMDACLEISLKEYGFAWHESDTEVTFIYGIALDGYDYNRWDWCSFDKNLDVKEEFDWADFNDLAYFSGLTEKEWFELPLTEKVRDLLNYYGRENVFGSSYWEGFSVKALDKKYDLEGMEIDE